MRGIRKVLYLNPSKSDIEPNPPPERVKYIKLKGEKKMDVEQLLARIVESSNPAQAAEVASSIIRKFKEETDKQ